MVGDSSRILRGKLKATALPTYSEKLPQWMLTSAESLKSPFQAENPNPRSGIGARSVSRRCILSNLSNAVRLTIMRDSIACLWLYPFLYH
jgi:hypothetical protein